MCEHIAHQQNRRNRSQTHCQHNRITAKYALILHDHGTRLADIPTGESAVLFLRDPAARFVSAFEFRQREGRPRHFLPWSEEERAIFTEFHTAIELALALSSAELPQRHRAQRAMDTIWHFKRPQIDWTGPIPYFLSRLPDVFFLGFQETLTEDFDLLKEKLGLPPKLSLPTDPIIANRSQSTRRTELSEQALLNLREWYAEDYELLELCKELRREDATCSSLAYIKGN